MALGKAEARDLVERERKTFTKYINKQRQEIEKIENDPEVKKIITLFKDDKTFNFSNENIKKHVLTRKAMEDYADLLLGKKILDYLESDPNRFGCTIYADH